MHGLPPGRSGPVRPAERRRLAERELTRVLDALPPQIQAEAARVVIQLEDGPDQGLLDAGFEPDLLGLFDGESVDSSCMEGFQMPPRILLYVENLWKYAGRDLTVFLDEVRRTFLHELGHFLGLDEEDLWRRDLD